MGNLIWAQFEPKLKWSIVMAKIGINLGNLKDKIGKDISPKEDNTSSLLEDTATLRFGGSFGRRNKRTEKFFPSITDREIELDKLICAPSEWNFFPTPPDNIYSLIKESIKAQGQLDPIVVWEQSDGKYMILGGHTRVKIFYELLAEATDTKEADFYRKIKAHVYSKDQIDEFDAREIIIIDNATQRAQEDLKTRVEMVKNYYEIGVQRKNRRPGVQRKRISEDIADKLGMSNSTVKRLISLRTLDKNYFSLVTEGSVTKEFLYTVSCLPEDIQKYILNEKIYDNDWDNERLKKLKSVKSMNDIDKIIAAPKNYSFSGKKVLLSYPIPTNYRKFSLAADEKDLPVVLKAFSESLNNLNISEKTKNILQEILKQQ